MKIPFYPYNKVFSSDKENYLKIFEEVCSKGSFIMQKELENFEKNMAEYSNCKFAIGVANATDAMELILMSSNLKQNGDILFCGHTMIATASAIKNTGFNPIPVEMDDNHYISIKDLKNKITQNTVAIMPTHLNGGMANMTEILNIAKEFNLGIIEDGAQALGAKVDDIMPGQKSFGSCISFYPAKTLGCFGDGGCILTNDKHIAEIIYKIRDHGRAANNTIELWGRNSRLDNLQAAILDYKLQNYDNLIKKRETIVEMYNDTLSKFDIDYLPFREKKRGTRYVYQNYEIRIKNRDKFKEKINENGVGTLIQWGGKSVDEFKIFNDKFNLPKTRDYLKSSLMLPLNEYLTFDEVDYICKVIKKACEETN